VQPCFWLDLGCGAQWRKPARSVTGCADATRELVVGDPSDPVTDLGPVIGAEVFAGIQKQLLRLNTEEKCLLAQSEQAREATYKIASSLVPQAYEIAKISDLKQQVFGPVLNIVRWTGDPLKVIEQINALGSSAARACQAPAPKPVARTTCTASAPSRASPSTPRRRGAMRPCWRGTDITRP
jgi:hypothetical protein